MDDDKQDFQDQLSRAVAGDAEAQEQVGRAYGWGSGGVEKNIEEALYWFELAAEQGNVTAMNGTGFMLACAGRNEEAVVWYRKAAALSNPFAQCNLAYCLYHGVGVAKNIKEAMTWFHKSAAQGHPEAEFNLGIHFWNEGHEAEAVEWFRKGAEQGDAGSQVELGGAYRDGIGVPRDLELAHRWFLAAAKKGSANGQYLVAVSFAMRPGGEKESLMWLRRACEQGHVQGDMMMGANYARGAGVEKNEEQAAAWFRTAAENGNLDGMRSIACCFRDGRGVAKDKAEARAWFQKASDTGDEHARWALDDLDDLEEK